MTNQHGSFDLQKTLTESGNVKPFILKEKLQNAYLTLYGAGESSHWFVEIVMKIHGFYPDIVLDRRYTIPGVYEGVKAFSPDHHDPSPEEKKGIVVVCVGSLSAFKEIRSFLLTKGYENIVSLFEIYEVHNPFMLPESWRHDPLVFFNSEQENIKQAYDLLEDQTSQLIFETVLQTHIWKSPQEIPRRPRNEQYFPTDIPLTKGYSRFVCCGAYDGDVIRSLVQEKGKVDEVVCFEADPKIFTRLTTYLQQFQNQIATHITALPCAIYDDHKVRNFTEATGLGSRLSPNGPLHVQCLSLDETLPNLKPTMVTMDIEGAELHALKGAENIIKKHQPDLAICVYHSIEHLWSLALYLHSLDLGYRFYLRNYTSFTIETVLYAVCDKTEIPKEE
ncbi:FkbM family methyltransferase [Terasakiella sp. SH-1]|uniref:FkbM family methyltransferase n=1 Tax=Terasakiella sp. SH-1 TaxID=2560057 RepID=UPI0010738E3F|nr:FkbM family methyltransferase [Terasakiella sp. SH-1]